MPTAPISLGAVLESVGTSLIDVVAGRITDRRPVHGVSIYDEYDDAPPPAGTIVLGVGVMGSRATQEFLDLAATQRAVAIVLRQPVTVDPSLLRTASASGLIVLGITAGVDWAHLATALARALDVPLDTDDDMAATGGGSPTDRLSDIANALADLLHAPLTIEDTDSRVLAFSRNQDSGDDSRKETILLRRVPRLYTDLMKANGIFRRIYSSDSPVRLEPSELLGVEQPRTVMRVVTGTSVAGSIWVCTEEALGDEDLALLRRTAEEVASILDHANRTSGRDAGRRRQTISKLLSGGAEAMAAARDLSPDAAFCLFLVAVGPGVVGAARAQHLAQIADGLTLHLASYGRGALAATAGDAVTGVLPLDGATQQDTTLQIAQRFADRIRQQPGLSIVITPVVTRAADLKQAHDEALQALRVLGLRSTPGTVQVARTEDAFLDVLLAEMQQRLQDSWAARGTVVRRLVDYDRTHDSALVSTLSAYLQCFGQVGDAANLVHVHANTFRYRLKRLQEISGIDLDDGDSRFRAQLELRLLGLET